MMRHHAWLSAAALLFLLSPVLPARAQQPSDAKGQFVDRVYRDDQGEHKYVVFVPAGYTPERKWPAILFLHGAGERGTDGQRQTLVGIGPFVKARAATFPFLVVFPQCEDTEGRALTGWLADSPDGKRAMAVLDQVEKQYSVDKQHLVLTGWSMGGYGVWSLAAAHPDRFSAIVPVSGGGEAEWADALKDVPVWAFHGATDTAVLPEATRDMIAALRKAGANPRYNEVAGAGHDVWKFVYDSDPLYAWMLDPRRAASEADKLLVEPGRARGPVEEAQGPFVPAVVIPQAVYVRLGNQMLETLAYAIPQTVSPTALSGRIDDIVTSTTAEGRSFRVVFSEITYSGKVHRVQVNGYRDERLNIQLGLEDVRLRIGYTSVRGSGRSASAGPIDVVIGNRRPVWLGMLVQPYVQDRRLRLRPVATRLQIPSDNWYVTPPAGVSTSGLGMTRERVSDGLVEGLYGSKGRIESEAKAIVPALLEQVEKQLDFSDVQSVVGSVWPLPVYKPRVELWPEEVSTDADGVSVVFSVAGAAVSPEQAPERPLVTDPAGFAVDRVPRTTALRVGVAPKMLEALSDQLIKADVMRVHVLDIAGEFFKPLSASQALANAAPDLERYGDNVDVWAELVLAQPFTVTDAAEETAGDARAALRGGIRVSNVSLQEPAAEGAQANEAQQEAGATEQPPEETKQQQPSLFQFVAPRLVVSYAIRGSETQGQWTPYAEFDLSLNQEARPRIVGGDAQRYLRLDWFDQAEISATARFAPGYEPRDPRIDAEPIRETFARGWRLWTLSAPASQVAVPDIDFGTTRLRISDVGWAAPYLYAAFIPPGVRITNSSEEPLVYELKGPFSGWSDPYTLPAGESHRFEVPYPLLFRRPDVDGLFTLPAGFHAEFRPPQTGGPPQVFQAREETAPPESAAPEDTEATSQATAATGR